MKARYAVLVVLALTVTLASAAAAGPEAAKQRVALTVTVLPSGKGVLTPLKGGALKRDSGTFSGNWSPNPDRTVVRDGQTVYINFRGCCWTFSGKDGDLVFKERNEWVDLGHDQNRDGNVDGIGTGTWKVVRGTGTYAGVKGSGGSAHLGLGRKWVARFEGFLTVPTG